MFSLFSAKENCWLSKSKLRNMINEIHILYEFESTCAVAPIRESTPNDFKSACMVATRILLLRLVSEKNIAPIALTALKENLSKLSELPDFKKQCLEFIADIDKIIYSNLLNHTTDEINKIIDCLKTTHSREEHFGESRQLIYCLDILYNDGLSLDNIDNIIYNTEVCISSTTNSDLNKALDKLYKNAVGYVLSEYDKNLDPQTNSIREHKILKYTV